MNIQKIVIDLEKQTRNPSNYVVLRQGDYGLQNIEIFVRKNGEPISIEGFSLKFEGNLSNENYVTGEAELIAPEEGKGLYTFSDIDTSVSGRYQVAFFRLYDKQGQCISSEDVIIDVKRNADLRKGEAEAYENEFTQLLNQFNEEWTNYMVGKTTEFEGLEEIYQQLIKKADKFGLDLSNLEKKLNEIDAYTKKETDQLLFNSFLGKLSTSTVEFDLKNKVAGSLVENPHISQYIARTSLLEFNNLSWKEFIGTRYEQTNILDGTVTSISDFRKNHITQVVFRWNIIEEIERLYAGLFESYGAYTLPEKVVVAKKIIKRVNGNVWGMGSGAEGLGLSVAIASYAGSWNGTKKHTNKTITKLFVSTSTNTPSYIQEDGTIVVNAYAPASDGVTASTITIDYASLELTLAISAAELFSNKAVTDKHINDSALHTTQEEKNTWNTKIGNKELISSFTGEAISDTILYDFKNKIAGSVVDNQNKMTRTAYPTLLPPKSITIENTQSQYNSVMNLDNNLYTQSTTVSGNIFQVMFSYNVIEIVEKRYPHFFEGIITIAEKILKLKQVLKEINFKVYGFAQGSGEKPNRMMLARWGGTYEWVTSQSSDSTMVTLLQGILTSESQITSSIDTAGYVYILAYAPASDDTEPSTVNIDYASLELTLSINASDIYAVKSDTYTKTEANEKFLQPATTLQAGIVKLANTTTSSSVTEAATANAVRVVAETLPNKANVSQVQMSKITNDNGTPVSEINSGSLLDFIKSMQVSYRTVSVSSNVTDRPNVATTFRGTIQKVANNTTGNVVLISDTGRVFTRTYYGGEWFADWIETADSNKAQLKKITADNGIHIKNISNGTVLSGILALGSGVFSISIGWSLSDSPIGNTQNIRAIAQMITEAYGNVIGISDDGRMFYRSIANRKWVGEWQELASKAQSQMQKITADDGRPVGTLTSGNILSVVTGSAGVKSYVSTSAVTDHPPTTQAFRFMSQMTSSTFGNVIGVADDGTVFSRAIVSGAWKNDWQQLKASQVPVSITPTLSSGFKAVAEQELKGKVTTESDNTQKVTLSGAITSDSGSIAGGSSAIVASIPVGYRPSKQMIFPAVGDGSTTAAARSISIVVYPSGEVRMTIQGAATTLVSLEGISYYL
ncbi:BppU family phage baseplate upper protein [Enterococcus sp. LJL128]